MSGRDLQRSCGRDGRRSRDPSGVVGRGG